MTILDTNVLSALMRQVPDAVVVAWLDQQPRLSIWTNSVTVLEVRFGIEIMATGKKRERLTDAFEKLLAKIDNRVAAFDEQAARQAATLMGSRQLKGRPQELRDTMIAGIVLAQHATLATRNIHHFQDLPVRLVNPWE